MPSGEPPASTLYIYISLLLSLYIVFPLTFCHLARCLWITTTRCEEDTRRWAHTFATLVAYLKSVAQRALIMCNLTQMYQYFSTFFRGLQPPRNQVDQWQENLMMKSWPRWWSNFQACAAIDINTLQEKPTKNMWVCWDYKRYVQNISTYCGWRKSCTSW